MSWRRLQYLFATDRSAARSESAPHLDLITKRDRAGKTSASDELSHNTKKKKKFGGSYSALSPKGTNFQDTFRLRVSGL